MTVALPFAPVDDIIRRNVGDLRVSTEAADRATDDGRKTLMASDFGVESVPDKDELVLPIAPVDRIARLDIDDRYRVAMDARVALATVLEAYADNVAAAAAALARHADRRTVKAEDVEAYFHLQQYFE
ncbi:aldolase [Halobacteriales archaeon SW_10_68_16]|nr:MAG: aldolase [Halobacteriales archaeon SW_10_68_16]